MDLYKTYTEDIFGAKIQQNAFEMAKIEARPSVASQNMCPIMFLY